MSTRWIVWGMGGHGSVVAELVGATGAVMAGFADRDPAGPASVDEVRLLDILSSGLPLPLDADHLALGIGDNAARLSAWQSIPAELAPPLIHPAAWRSPSAEVDAGTVVMPRAVLHTNVRIGQAVIINTGAVIEHDCVIGDGAHISPGAILAGAVRVGRGAWIGAGAVVLPGRCLGVGAVVGAGAVVTRDVPAGATVAGNPARALPTSRGGPAIT